MIAIAQLLHLILIAHELHDDADVLVKVLGGDDAHQVAGVLRVRVAAPRVHHDQHCVSRLQLKKKTQKNDG